MNKPINFTLPAKQPHFTPKPPESIGYLQVGNGKALSMLYYPSEDFYKIFYIIDIYNYNLYEFRFKDKEEAKSKFLELAEELVKTGKITGFNKKEDK